jgi:predicted esterase
MTNRPRRNLEVDERLRPATEDAAPPLRLLYADFCKPENLEAAYAQIKKESEKYGVDPLVLEAVEAEGVETFLTRLSRDLQARTYQPATTTPQAHPKCSVENRAVAALRDLVVQATLKRLLEAVFPPAFPSDPQPEKTIQWLAANIDRGFCRAYVLSVGECSAVKQHPRLLEKIRQRIDDPDLIRLLADILAASAEHSGQQPQLLAPLLTAIALDSLDPILQQTKAFGREGNFLHVHCTRVGNQLVILLDQNARYDWLLPAVQKRLREELAQLHYDLAAVETQTVDLTRGGTLRFLGYELRLVKGKQGQSRVRYKLLEETAQRPSAGLLAKRRLRWRYQPLRFARPLLNWIGRHRVWLLLQDACNQIASTQVGWRHLPLTLYPVVALLFGWRSPLAWLCLALLFACHGRRMLGVAYGVVGSLGEWAWRHKGDVVTGVCGLAALSCIYVSASDFYAHCSREDVMPDKPPGFAMCQYNRGSPWEPELLSYGLYVPPHFRKEKGPFPLIVYLHGYGQRSKELLFQEGVPRCIAMRYGPFFHTGPFPFVAFFPHDPTGQWSRGSVEVDNAMLALDYVVERHHIDPARVYLTGLSSGGDGVWTFAESYPDRWAAVAPVSGFSDPDVQKVRHLPLWIFHGAKDQVAPVERERRLVQRLKKAGADVRYTEVAEGDHVLTWEPYDSGQLFQWFAQIKR